MRFYLYKLYTRIIRIIYIRIFGSFGEFVRVLQIAYQCRRYRVFFYFKEVRSWSDDPVVLSSTWATGVRHTICFSKQSAALHWCYTAQKRIMREKRIPLDLKNTHLFVIKKWSSWAQFRTKNNSSAGLTRLNKIKLNSSS